MNELEAAFFYGDFSSFKEVISNLLYENYEKANTHEEIFDVEVAPVKEYNRD